MSLPRTDTEEELKSENYQSFYHNSYVAEESLNQILIDTREIPSVDNPLGISDELRLALERASREQMEYEIPVDLDTCTEEEKEFWLIKRANRRNGGRVRENPLLKEVSLEECKRDDGQWIK